MLKLLSDDALNYNISLSFQELKVKKTSQNNQWGFVFSYVWPACMFPVPSYKLMNAFDMKADEHRMKAN